MSAIESCECCLAEAPSWTSDEYAEWVLLLARDGEYLGVVCAGCLAEEELLLLELEEGIAVRRESRLRERRRRSRPARGAGPRRAGRRAAPSAA